MRFAISSFLAPLWTPTRMPSVTTIALSTIMPRAMMSAPREMRCMGMSAASIVARVAKIVISRIAPITTADRSPMKSNSVTMTMTSAAITLATKTRTDSSTIFPWW